MRCRKSERLISDEIDGSLPAGKKAGLEKHLRSCRSCREYRVWHLGLKEKTARIGSPAVEAGYWEGSLSRLREALESLPEASGSRERARDRGAFAPSLRWAWGAAPALLVAAAAAYLSLVPPRGPVGPMPLNHEDGAGRVVALIGNDESLEAEFSDLIQAEILENRGEPEKDVTRLIYGASRFLDGLSEEELQTLETRLAAELKI